MHGACTWGSMSMVLLHCAFLVHMHIQSTGTNTLCVHTYRPESVHISFQMAEVDTATYVVQLLSQIQETLHCANYFTGHWQQLHTIGWHQRVLGPTTRVQSTCLTTTRPCWWVTC